MDTKDYLKGNSNDGYTFFGCQKKSEGYIFRILAPNASIVYIMGDFSDWKRVKLRKYQTGVFSTTIKNAKVSDRYQYIIVDQYGNESKKIDPYSKLISNDENTSIIYDTSYKFENGRIDSKKLNIYQIHYGSFLKSDKDLDMLISHVKDNNFTHIELMPVTEYLDYKSMGYVSNGLFAFSNRYGDAIDFKRFIDKAHENNIGVILELDISSFDSYKYYLDKIDGSDLYTYDYEDIKYNYYGQINFDPSKNLTKSYLKSVISYWIDEFNVDGINISNLQNIIYWQGDSNRGINKAWDELLNDITKLIHSKNTLALASFAGFYNLSYDFDYVFDLSMRDILKIFQKHPAYRNDYRKSVQKLLASDNSNKLLGFNHIDSFLNEASLAMKMYGDDKLSQLKTLFTILYTINSQKMIFMTDEIASLKTFSIYENPDFDMDSNLSRYFNEYYKDISKYYVSTDISKTHILDIEGYSIYGFISEINDKKNLVLINTTDLSYKIKSLYDMDELINSNDLRYGGDGNINGKLNKNDFINIAPFGAGIFEIKKDEN